MATAQKCECGKEANCWHICRVKKKGYVGAAQVKAYTSEANFECTKCGAKVAKAEYVCFPKAIK